MNLYKISSQWGLCLVVLIINKIPIINYAFIWLIKQILEIKVALLRVSIIIALFL